MLPDYITLKRDLSKFTTRYLRARIRANLEPWQDQEHIIMHEGDGRIQFINEHGESVTQTQQSESTSSVTNEQLRTWTIENVKEQLDVLASDVASQMSKRMFSAIEREMRAAGNAVDSRAGFTAETYIDAIENLAIPFGGDGQPKLPTPMVHPSAAEKIQQQLDRLQAEPALRLRLEAVVERKREEWNAREANRELVG